MPLPLPPETVAAYHPLGNAQLAFRVSHPTDSVEDPETGLMVPVTEEVVYLARLEQGVGNWRDDGGLDLAIFPVRGRLLDPFQLDPRIATGAIADCLLDGRRGVLELSLDMGQRLVQGAVQRDLIAGTFRLVGTGGEPHRA